MKIKFGFIFLLAALIINLHCSRLTSARFDGKLFLSNLTSSLRQLDLRTLEEKEVYQDKTIGISYVTKISNDSIIFSDGSSPPLLKLFKIANNEVQTLREGTSPAYITEHNTLCFYVTDISFGKVLPMSLYVGSLSDLENSRMICPLSENDSSRHDLRERPVVQISKDHIVFVGRTGALTEYDFSNGELSETSLKNIYPLAWRDKSKELLCCDRKAEKFTMVEWSTKKTREIDLDENDTAGWTYLKEYDVLLFENSFFGYHDLYVYDFRDATARKLKSPGGLNSGIYIPPESIPVAK